MSGRSSVCLIVAMYVLHHKMLSPLERIKKSQLSYCSEIDVKLYNDVTDVFV